MTRLFLLFALLTGFGAVAQDQPVGYWQAHMPYSRPTAVATDGAVCYVAAGQAFFTYDAGKDLYQTYSKVDGMHDVTVTHVAYDAVTQTAVLAYANSNLDLFVDGEFYNLPDIKLKSTTASKTINALCAANGLVYAATDLGVVVINTARQEIKETYVFTKGGQNIPVTGIALQNNYLIAGTPSGIYRAPASAPNLQDFSVWQAVDSFRSIQYLVHAGAYTYAAAQDSIFKISSNGDLSFFYRATDLKGMSASMGQLFVSNYENDGTTVRIANESGAWVDSFSTPLAREVATLSNGWMAVADDRAGLGIRTGGNDIRRIIPPGPNDFVTFDILADHGDVWIAHGALTEGYTPVYSNSGLSHRYPDGRWKLYNPATLPILRDTVFDLYKIAKDPNDGTIYGGTYYWGMLKLNPNTDEASILKKAEGLDLMGSSPKDVTVSGIAFDDAGRLWVSQHGTQRQLGVRLEDGSWRHFGILASSTLAYAAANLIIDKNNQKWYTMPAGGGVVVYNDGGTPDNPNDDGYRQLGQGLGNGGLPTNIANTVVADRDGAVWIGTTDGIGVVSCPAQVIALQCEATKPIVQYDQFAGFLFQNENVLAIAVDGANRKWIGTLNGLWLVSPTGNKIIYRFTTDNSPLPANRIRVIKIDETTGDVYVGTDAGMVSFKSTATAGNSDEKIADVLVYPNPVPSGYGGMIAIRGLGTDADVRITDVAGQMVYRTRALGGQAVWNGLDYTGKRPQSGVYLIFAAGAGGTQRYIGKMIFAE